MLAGESERHMELLPSCKKSGSLPLWIETQRQQLSTPVLNLCFCMHGLSQMNEGEFKRSLTDV
jgi:hypothetical protein